ncbi:MAG: hypothetical protein MUC43_02960 [Pirellula sp.]|jgi:hypothetical protein|nr:hypothetical protein [Pirellula sp.]
MSSPVSHSSRKFRPLVLRNGRIPVALSLGATFLVSSWLITSQWQNYRYAKDDSNLQFLNELAACYAASTGMRPDVNLIDLYKSGMTDRRLQPTPFGGYYRYDYKTGIVYNPHRVESRPQAVQTASLGNR